MLFSLNERVLERIILLSNLEPQSELEFVDCFVTLFNFLPPTNDSVRKKCNIINYKTNLVGHLLDLAVGRREAAPWPEAGRGVARRGAEWNARMQTIKYIFRLLVTQFSNVSLLVPPPGPQRAKIASKADTCCSPVRQTDRRETRARTQSFWQLLSNCQRSISLLARCCCLF